MKHVCVIGAGIIGITTAWQLARRGWQVTVVDAAGEPATGTSFANGGQLSYSYVAPLANPGVLPHLPGWLLSPRSPLRFRPRLDPDQWRWCLRFLRACTASTAARSAAQMLTLSYLSRDVLHDLLQEVPIDFAHARNGKLIVYRTPALVEKARRQVEYQARLGSEQQVLDAAACVAREPALAGVADRIAGAIYTPSEESGDCARLARGLADHLRTTGQAAFRWHTEVARLEGAAGRIRAAVTTGGESLQADHYVVAAGLASNRLLAPLGVASQLYGLKGYSLTVPCRPEDAPAISVTDYERRTVYVQLGGVLRIAAMVGIGVLGTGIEADRIDLIKQQARALLPHIDLRGAQPWAGQRPATASGKPLIGASPRAENLWVNIGHGALGFTLACGSAKLLGELMSGQPASIPAEPFLPAHRP